METVHSKVFWEKKEYSLHMPGKRQIYYAKESLGISALLVATGSHCD